MEPVEPVQWSIFQSNTYRKGLSWLHFDGEPRVQEKQKGSTFSKRDDVRAPIRFRGES